MLEHIRKTQGDSLLKPFFKAIRNDGLYSKDFSNIQGSVYIHLQFGLDADFLNLLYCKQYFVWENGSSYTTFPQHGGIGTTNFSHGNRVTSEQMRLSFCLLDKKKICIVQGSLIQMHTDWIRLIKSKRHN